MLSMRIESRDPETSTYSKVLYASDMDKMILKIRHWLKTRGVRKYALTVLDDVINLNKWRNEKHKGY